MKQPQSSTSSGFIIEYDAGWPVVDGKTKTKKKKNTEPNMQLAILCNAHGVEYHSSIRVRRHGDSEKYLAKVLYIGHECDLALLTVEDPAFYRGDGDDDDDNDDDDDTKHEKTTTSTATK
jgi:hypothetical protein